MVMVMSMVGRVGVMVILLGCVYDGGYGQGWVVFMVMVMVVIPVRVRVTDLVMVVVVIMCSGTHSSDHSTISQWGFW
jgi:hypothetical protein